MNVILVFFLLMAAIQIAGMVYCGKERKKDRPGLAKGTVAFLFALSAAYDLIFFGIIAAYDEYLGWNSITYYLVCAAALCVYFLLFLIGLLIFRKDRAGEDTEQAKRQKADRKQKHLVVGIMASVCFVAAVTGEYLVFQSNRKQIYAPTKKEIEKAKNMAEQYLMEKYGDGNYVLSDMKLGIPTGFMFDAKYKGFDLTYTTSYMESAFRVSVDIFDEGVWDNFIDTYYWEKEQINFLEEYLLEQSREKLNGMLPEEFEASFVFLNDSCDIPGDAVFGKVPSLSELSVYALIGSPKLVIEKELHTKEELLQYLVDFFLWYQSHMEAFDIHYRSGEKYFTYQYDLSKLGDLNGITYPEYSGYVMAGEYVSSDGGGYELVGEDEIVCFCVDSRIYTFTLAELGLK